MTLINSFSASSLAIFILSTGTVSASIDDSNPIVCCSPDDFNCQSTQLKANIEQHPVGNSLHQDDWLIFPDELSPVPERFKRDVKEDIGNFRVSTGDMIQGMVLKQISELNGPPGVSEAIENSLREPINEFYISDIKKRKTFNGVHSTFKLHVTDPQTGEIRGVIADEEERNGPIYQLYFDDDVDENELVYEIPFKDMDIEESIESVEHTDTEHTEHTDTEPTEHTEPTEPTEHATEHATESVRESVTEHSTELVTEPVSAEHATEHAEPVTTVETTKHFTTTLYSTSYETITSTVNPNSVETSPLVESLTKSVYYLYEDDEPSTAVEEGFVSGGAAQVINRIKKKLNINAVYTNSSTSAVATSSYTNSSTNSSSGIRSGNRSSTSRTHHNSASIHGPAIGALEMALFAVIYFYL